MFYILFAISFGITYSIIPFLIDFGQKLNFIDIPNKRKVHTKPVVRSGGIGIFITYILLMLFLRIFASDNYFSQTNNLFSIFLICNIFIFILGLIDDLYSLSPFLRLTIQFIVTSLLWINNVRIESINFSLFDNLNTIVLPPWISLIFSSIVIIGIMNAINWFDGLDGLATGIILFSLISIFTLNQNFNNEIIDASTPILFGSCLAFLKYNFYPSKIIMGDSGSNSIGFNLALLGILASTNSPVTDMALKESYYVNIEMLLIIFSIPILDMTYVILNRLINKRSPFYPDKTHLHHRMIDFGFNYNQTIFNIYLYSFTNTLLVIFLNTNNYFYFALFILFSVISILNIFITLRKKKSNEIIKQ